MHSDAITEKDVETCIFNSLSYIVADVDPDDELDRLGHVEERVVLRFLIDFQSCYSGCTVKSVGIEPLVLNIDCSTIDSLNRLTEENKSGNLADQLETCLSRILVKKMDIWQLFLETEISPLQYKLCKRILGKEGIMLLYGIFLIFLV